MALKKRKNFTRFKKILPFIFLSPWLLGFLVFTLFPFIYTIYLSFMDVRFSVAGFNMTFVGLNNYAIALVTNTLFIPSLLEFLLTLIIYTPIIVIISFVLALALNTDIKGKGIFRTIYFLPAIVLSGPVLFRLTETSGEQDIILQGVFVYEMITIYSQPLANAFNFMFENFVMVLWLTGVPIVLFISALQKINISLFEAAKMDGATFWVILWKIILPLTKSMTQVVALFTIVQLGVFSTNPVFDIIREASMETTVGLGFAATYAWIYSLMVMIFIATTFMLLRDKHLQEAKPVKKRSRRRRRS